MHKIVRSTVLTAPFATMALAATPAFAQDADPLAGAKATLLERVSSAEGIMLAVVVGILAFTVLRRVLGR